MNGTNPNQMALSVTDVNRYIKSLFGADGLLSAVAVRGEISTFKAHSSGHLYFTLKDGSSELAAVMFRGDAMRMGFRPMDGMRVIAYGRVDVYEKSGRYQLYALGGQNIGLFQWRFKPSGGEYGPWQTFSDKLYGTIVAELALEREKAYFVQLRVTDTAGSVAEITLAVPAEQIYMHKTPNALGIGGYADGENNLAVHWDITAHKAINGAYIRTLSVPDTTVTIPGVDTVLVAGGGVLGLLHEGVWSGTEGVTATPTDEGVTLNLPRAGSRLLLFSPEAIEI